MDRITELLEILGEAIKPKGKRIYHIMVNNELLVNQTYVNSLNQKVEYGSHLVSCRFVTDKSNDGQLEVGNTRRVDGRPTFIVEETLETQVLFKSLNLVFDGIDCNRYLVDTFFRVEVNDELRIVNVINSGFEQLFNNIYKDSDVRSAGVTVNSPSGEVIDHKTILGLYNYFDRTSIDNYALVYARKLRSHLKRANLKFQDGNTMKFYKMFGVWEPVLIKGLCVFNPFLESKSNFELMSKTEFYNLALKHCHSVNNMTIMYMTHLNISRTLNFEKPINCEPYFLTSLIGGLFQDTLPRTDRYVYYSTVDGRPISSEDFEQLPQEDKSYYTPESTLRLWCRLNVRRTNVTKVDDFYRIVRDVKLLNKGDELKWKKIS